jgi:hypothetical protein
VGKPASSTRHPGACKGRSQPRAGNYGVAANIDRVEAALGDAKGHRSTVVIASPNWERASSEAARKAIETLIRADLLEEVRGRLVT